MPSVRAIVGSSASIWATYSFRFARSTAANGSRAAMRPRPSSLFSSSAGGMENAPNICRQMECDSSRYKTKRAIDSWLAVDTICQWSELHFQPWLSVRGLAASSDAFIQRPLTYRSPASYLANRPFGSQPCAAEYSSPLSSRRAASGHTHDPPRRTHPPASLACACSGSSRSVL